MIRPSLLIFSAFLFLGLDPTPLPITGDDPVATILYDLGKQKPDHYLSATDPEKVKLGEELVKTGRATLPDGTRSAYISKYYTCTSCHNLEREDPDLTKVDQDARLKWAMDRNLPYVQASTFWGMVNRTTWYNDDYVLKYGDLVRKAENSLKESVQLCAQVCSQGRPVTDEEMEQFLSYFWSLQMKISDLNISPEEMEKLNTSILTNEEKTRLIQSKFLSKSPATFVEPPLDKWEGYPYEGRPELGKAIFELGCQHCHRPHGESNVVFEPNSLTLRWLKRHIPDNSDLSIYQIVRKGTYSEYGHREYMPHYTLEKISDQQMEDLRAFIEAGS